MSKSRFLPVAALALATLAGCAAAETRAASPCSLIGTRSGIGVDIDAAIAKRVDTAKITVCWDGSCRTPPVNLTPNTRTIDDGCTGTGPDGVCSAHAEATGGKRGFADLVDLPAGPVEVTVTLADPAGARIVDQTLALTPKMSYPNGPHCGGGGPQGHIRVDADGTVHSTG